MEGITHYAMDVYNTSTLVCDNANEVMSYVVTRELEFKQFIFAYDSWVIVLLVVMNS